MKSADGIYRPDAGVITYKGVPVEIRTPEPVNCSNQHDPSRTQLDAASDHCPEYFYRGEPRNLIRACAR